MVRPANVPSPHITKLGSLKKKADGPKKISPKGSDAKITKKKKKQRKEKEAVVPEKKSKTKKKRLKKVPREVVEQIRAMKNKGRKEPDVPPPSNESDESRIEVVTSAAVKRVATRVGIACISNEASKTPPHTPCHRAPPLSSSFQFYRSIRHQRLHDRRHKRMPHACQIFGTLHLVDPYNPRPQSRVCHGNYKSRMPRLYCLDPARGLARFLILYGEYNSFSTALSIIPSSSSDGSVTSLRSTILSSSSDI